MPTTTGAHPGRRARVPADESEGPPAVRHYFEAKKPVAAICHGVRLLAPRALCRGGDVRYPACRAAELERAGRSWVDHNETYSRRRG
jgi:protease I